MIRHKKSLLFRKGFDVSDPEDYFMIPEVGTAKTSKSCYGKTCFLCPFKNPSRSENTWGFF